MTKLTCEDLVAAVEADEVVMLDDEELLNVAQAAVTELRRRMPRYAFEQHDFSWEDAEAVQRMVAAEDACEAVEALAEAWKVNA